MDDPAFRSQLTQMRENSANLAHAALQGIMLKSVHVIAEALDSADGPTRLRAARIALYVALKADEAHDIKRRMDVLDASLTLLKSQR